MLAIREIVQALFVRTSGLSSSKKQSDLKSYLLKGYAGSLLLRIASTGLAFIMSVMLARFLGTEGYGIYSYAFAWALLLGVFSVMGFDKLVVRYIAVYRSKRQWSLLHGLVKRTDHAVLVVSIALVAASISATWSLLSSNKMAMRNAMVIAFLILPVLSLIRLRQSALQGMERVVKGQVPEMIIQPILFIVLLSGAYFFLGRTVSAQQAVLLFVLTAVCTLILLMYMFKKSFPVEARTAVPGYETNLWLKTALPLLFIDSMYLINSRTDIIMLGAIKGPVSAGIYNVANRGAELVTFVLISVNIVIAPTIAALYAKSDKKRLQNVITLSARAIFLFSLPVMVLLIAFGKYFLMIFGTEFNAGYPALTILSIAQLLNCAMGPVGILLIMTGHQKQAAIGVTISALLNIIFNAVFIPIWGIKGAATATGMSLVVWSAIFVFWVYRNLDIHTTALGRIGWLEKKSRSTSL